MLAYIARRILLMIPTILGIMLIFSITAVPLGVTATLTSRRGARLAASPALGGVGRKSPSPQAVTEHHDVRATGQILLRRERPPHHQSRTKQAEVIGTHLPRPQLLRKLPSGVVHDVGAKCRRILNHRRLLSPVRKLGGRGIRSRSLRRRVHEKDDAIRVWKRDWLKKDGADD